jgi:non-specific serine/threonine protein kinase
VPHDVVLDDEGLWATVPLAGVAAVPRAVPTRAGMRAGQAWPLEPDAALPAALAATLEAPPELPLDGLVAVARLAAAAREVAAAGLVPAPRPDGPGWRWQAAPGPAAAGTWSDARRAAADALAPGRPSARAVVDDFAAGLVAAFAGPVTDLPDELPPRLSFRRSAALRRWADRVAARRAADARLAFRLDAPPGDDADALDGEPWRLVPLAVRLSEDTTRRPLASSDPVDDFGTTSAAWSDWLLAEAAGLRSAWPEGTVAAWARLFLPVTDEDDDAAGERWARATGASVALDVEEVLGLLDHGAQALADAGFDVVAESGLLRRSRVRTRARSTSVDSGLTAGGLALTVGVSVDGVELTPEEIAALASSKADLVVVRGRWTRVDDGERARLARLLDRLRSPVTAADLVADEAFDGVEAEPPQQLAVAQRTEPPAGLLATLRHYQRDGLDWLTWVEENRTGGVLADDMGLGKTVQVIARVLADVQSGAAGPTLVVCPLTLVDTWARQVEQFAPSLRVAVHHGASREDVAILAEEADLVLTTYGLLARDESLRAVAWHRVVLDEAQAVKNPDTRTSRAARALTATHRLAVTGTPVENHLGELWSVMAFAAPGILPRRKDFERVFVRAGVGEEALSRLRVATAPFVLRRTKSDPGVAPDLPPRTVIREDCALTREQVGAYEAAAAAMLEQVGDGGAGRRLHVLAGISRLKQILVHPAMLTERRTGLAGRSGKVDRLVELAAQIVDEGQAVVVFTQFASFVPALATHLRAALGVDVLTLTGADDRKARADVVERFGADDGPPVLVVSLKAGGTGLTLVRANHVVHLDRWWNPAVEDQASDRVWRIGQKQKVFVHTLVCPGTLEDRIDAMLAGKRAVASSVVRSTDTRVTELTDGELAELVTLVRDRVLT